MRTFPQKAEKKPLKNRKSEKVFMSSTWNVEYAVMPCMLRRDEMIIGTKKRIVLYTSGISTPL